ncbi:MAG: RsmD family RNA methyltransferase [Lentisphaeria bacterium]|nr:RsmD family RNA methyltransferase [Lentisphaeria bacterium]
MGVRIIAGTARNLELAAPPGVSVRPTLIRVRKALFDSLGPLTGLHVTDLFAGSGALGLESASRGAASVQLVERAADHWPWLDRNAAAVQRTGAAAIRIVRSDVREVSAWGRQVSDLIFADPPYADSAEYFTGLMEMPGFRRAAAGAKIIWEIPDIPGAAGYFLSVEKADFTIRQFCGTRFWIGSLQE